MTRADQHSLALAAVVLAGLAPSVHAHSFSVLVFSRTAGFRHDCIPAGRTAIQELGAANDFAVTLTENAADFTDANLAQYAAVIFLCTTGDVLNGTQQGAFERYIQSGKGFVGIHSASDTEYSWPWYGGLIGAYFSNHPAIQQATIKVADQAHPSTSPLPARWQRTDEWYNFSSNPRSNVHVLATLDESTYTGGQMGHDHPIAWCQYYGGGRAWYTAGGHTIASYSETLFRQHLLGGIRFAADDVECDCGATIASNFQAVVLDATTRNPMQLSIAPDGRVFFVERTGQVKIYRPASQNVVLAGQLSVTTANEDGLLGIALDPSFAVTGWVYLFYSPPTPAENRLSRFTIVDETLQLASEKILLRVPMQRVECCHSAGGLRFGPDGLLYLTVGDNTNPFDSNGFTPIDERPNRSAWDAQKSSSNRNDLRGKILRIRPESDGTYSIPGGNLFPPDGSNGRPEIYVMGCRNPFRASIDSERNWLYWGDVGPDASGAVSGRGPAGLDEINQTRSAGNYGWPYCIGQNLPYNDYNFGTGQSGPLFNCNAPINNSPNNTGGQQLPAAQPAFIWYPYSASGTFPELGTGGRTALAGPVYHYNALSSSIRFPAYYDDTLFITEFSRRWIKEVKLDENGNLLKINAFLPGLDLHSPIDMDMGPDGAMYVLEWGTGSGNNADARLQRIEYLRAESLSPIAVASANPSSGLSPLLVQFSSAGSYDPDPGDVITYAWSFTSNGNTDSTAPNPTHTYLTPGNYVAQLTVRDPGGNTGVANVPVTVGNTAPTIDLVNPPNGGIYNWGDMIPFVATAADLEDGSTPAGIPCTSLITTALIGHDSHAHSLGQYSGCNGSVPTPSSTGHDLTDNLYFVLQASYTDLGAPGVASLTGLSERRLRPKLRQAEQYTTASGVTAAPSADPAGGGLDVINIDHGDWVAMDTLNLQSIVSISYRYAAAGAGGAVEVHVDAPGGPLFAYTTLASTGSAQTYSGAASAIVNPVGTHTLYFVFTRSPGATDLFALNWIDFIGPGVAAGQVQDIGAPQIALAPTSIDRTVIRGNAAPVEKIAVNNGGSGTLNYTVQSNAAWLGVYPASGSSVGEPDTFTLTYQIASLPAGHHNAQLTITAPRATNNPRTLSVTLHHLSKADYDADGDVDMDDFARFQLCMTSIGTPIPPGCGPMDHNQDTAIDTADLQIFLPCLAGAKQDPGC